MGVRISCKGSFSKTFHLLNKIPLVHDRIMKKMDKYGKKGVDALRLSTPKRTGKTADSWQYEVLGNKEFVKIIWSNTNVVNDWANVAVLIQYGHGTRYGGYVQGIDYINPAMRPIFEEIAKEAWAEVIGDE